MRTDGYLQWRFSNLNADGGLEPLAMIVQQRQEGYRRLADIRSENHQIVKRLLGVRVEDCITVQRGQSRCFCGQSRRIHRHLHGRTPGKRQVRDESYSTASAAHSTGSTT